MDKGKYEILVSGITKNLDVANFWYRLFVKQIPEGYSLYSHSKNFKLNKDDLFISNKPYIESKVNKDVMYKEIPELNIYVTSDGRVWNKITESFIYSEYGSYTFKNKCYNIRDLLGKCFVDNFNNYKYLIPLDGDYNNISLGNLKYQETMFEHLLEENEKCVNMEGTNYYISSYGKVFSDLNKQYKKMKTHFTKKGYEVITLEALFRKGKKRNNRVNRLVAEYFLEGFSEEKEVNHIDRNILNNKVTNLEIVTGDENIVHFLLSDFLKNNSLSISDFKYLRGFCVGYFYYINLPKDMKNKISKEQFNKLKSDKGRGLLKRF